MPLLTGGSAVDSSTMVSYMRRSDLCAHVHARNAAAHHVHARVHAHEEGTRAKTCTHAHVRVHCAYIHTSRTHARAPQPAGPPTSCPGGCQSSARSGPRHWRPCGPRASARPGSAAGVPPPRRTAARRPHLLRRAWGGQRRGGKKGRGGVLRRAATRGLRGWASQASAKACRLRPGRGVTGGGHRQRPKAPPPGHAHLCTGA